VEARWSEAGGGLAGAPGGFAARALRLRRRRRAADAFGCAGGTAGGTAAAGALELRPLQARWRPGTRHGSREVVEWRMTRWRQGGRCETRKG